MRPPLLLAALGLAVAPGLARARQTGLSYGDFAVRGDDVEVALRVASADVRAAGLGEEGVTRALGAIRVTRGARPCGFVAGHLVLAPPDGVRLSGAFRCAPSRAPFQVELAGLLHLLPWGHTHLAKVTLGPGVQEHVLGEGRSSFAIQGPTSWASQAARFVRLGLEHIFTGTDHIAFVLGLLLLGGSLRQVIGVVTSFTLAHSVTLAAASLAWIRLPASLVEPLIAASIVAVAVENLVELGRAPEQRRPGRRAILAFAFGLVHGFGFAGALTELHLSAAGLATALFSFNVGVELGQAAIVAGAYPLVRSLRRWRAGAPLALKLGSAAIGVAGVLWLAQRLPWPRLA